MVEREAAACGGGFAPDVFRDADEPRPGEPGRIELRDVARHPQENLLAAVFGVGSIAEKRAAEGEDRSRPASREGLAGGAVAPLEGPRERVVGRFARLGHMGHEVLGGEGALITAIPHRAGAREKGGAQRIREVGEN